MKETTYKKIPVEKLIGIDCYKENLIKILYMAPIMVYLDV